LDFEGFSFVCKEMEEMGLGVCVGVIEAEEEEERRVETEKNSEN
jgi:hypothetical protein